MKYPHIFSPGRIGTLPTKNRIKYAATETNFNTQDGFVTEREIAYMEAQARGGAAIVTTQGAYPDAKERERASAAPCRSLMTASFRGSRNWPKR